MTTHWFSPFHLPETILRRLEKGGRLPWSGQGEPPEELLLIYLPPHAVLQDPQELLSRYERLKGMAGRGPLRRGEHLLSTDPAKAEAQLAAPRPLEALVTLTMLREQPAILDAYLDLELQAELGGESPDTDYLARLRQIGRIPALLQELDNTAIRQRASQLRQEFHQQQLQRLEQELSESRQDLNQTLQQLQQRDQDYQQLTLAAAESALKEEQLQQRAEQLSSEGAGLQEANGRLLESLNRLHNSQRQIRLSEAEARARCESLEEQLDRRDQDLTRLQTSHQAEEALVQAQQQQISRASQLLQELKARQGLVAASGQPAIQVLALLEGYRHSLKRAERLLLGNGG